MTEALQVAPPRDGAMAAHFLESLVCDMHWTCLHVGTIHYLVQAACQQGQGTRLAAWRHLLCDTTGILHLGLRYGRDIGLPAEALATLTAFLDGLAEALARTQRLLRQAGRQEALAAQDLRQLRMPWAEIARRAERSLAALEPVTRAGLPVEYAANARIVAGFLKEGLGGETARLNEWGEIALPALAQRRRHARARVERRCTLALDDRTCAAVLTDVSRIGLGLRCEAELPVGTRVTVCLDDGRRLEARVARSRGSACGLELATPLASGDPLLQG